MGDRERPESPDEIHLSSGQDARRQAFEGPGDWYAFRVEGHLAPCWSEWLDGLAIAHLETGETLLTGPVVDQAALHGLLVKLRDLNLPLVSLCRIKPGARDDREGAAHAMPGIGERVCPIACPWASAAQILVAAIYTVIIWKPYMYLIGGLT